MVNALFSQLQWRNYVRRGEAAASGRQATGGADEFDKNDPLFNFD